MSGSASVTRRPNTTCVLCSTPMYRKPKVMAAGSGRFCSRRCRNRAYPPPRFSPRKANYGPKNGSWKGGVTLKRSKGNYGGVRHVRAPDWARPMARSDGYIAEHRLVMAAWVGRLLDRTEVVNHVDHDPSHNERSNLDLWPSNADHKRGEVGRAAIGVANRRFREDSVQP